jgi:hypothetical protein
MVHRSESAVSVQDAALNLTGLRDYLRRIDPSMADPCWPVLTANRRAHAAGGPAALAARVEIMADLASEIAARSGLIPSGK